MNPYLLTVIIPHYNSPKLLHKLLESIMIQNKIQVIVVDDNSDQEISEYRKCKMQFIHKGVEFYQNTGKKGAGSCRNIGLSKALGRWILFADADDFFLPEYYEKLVPYFESDYDLVFFVPTSRNLETMKLGTRHIPYERVIRKYLKNPNVTNEMQLRYEYVSPWSKLFRAEILHNNKVFFEEITTGNDSLFSVKASFYSKKIHADKNIIYCISRRNNSLTANISEEQFDVRLDAFIRRYHFLKNNLTKTEFCKMHPSALEKVLRAICSHYNLKKIMKIIRHLKKSKVRIVSWEELNPLYIIPLILEGIKSIYHDRKYLHK